MIRQLAACAQDSEIRSGDVCVIGGGLAGLLAASRISELGHHVIVVESGGRRPNGSLDALNEAEQAEPTYQTAASGRVRSLGGTSTTWGGRMLPLTMHDLAARRYLGLDAWPVSKADLDLYLPDIERLFGLDGSPYEEPRDRMDGVGVSRPPDDLVARWAKWPPFRRRNVAELLRRQIDHAPRLEIWLNAAVCDLVVDREAGRLSGVVARSCSNKSLRVTAERFIFAAGTLETTRLLLLLDRVSEQHAFARTDALGAYFNDHLAVEVGRLKVMDTHRVNRMFGYHISGSTRRSLHLETTAAAQRADCTASGYVTVRPEYGDRSLHHVIRHLGRSAQRHDHGWITPTQLLGDLASVVPAAYWKARFGQMYLSSRVDLRLDLRIEQVPSMRSTLSLSQSRCDAFGVPLLKIDWHKTQDDDRTFRAVLRRMRRYWTREGLDAISPVAWSIDPDDAELGLAARARDTRHPAGSARMGTDPASSVVNARLQCHAVPNVFVASAATFPSSGSANPSLTIMQLALRAADAACQT